MSAAENRRHGLDQWFEPTPSVVRLPVKVRTGARGFVARDEPTVIETVVVRVQRTGPVWISDEAIRSAHVDLIAEVIGRILAVAPAGFHPLGYLVTPDERRGVVAVQVAGYTEP